MNESQIFRPNIRRGFTIHTVSALALLLAGAWSVWRASQTDVGTTFLLYLAPAVATGGLGLWFAYRAYALLRGAYILERDGIRLLWGLRNEDIPIDTVRWVCPIEEFGARLPAPLLRIPGAILGSRRLPEKGRIEYLAASMDGLVIIETDQRAYAISPANRQEFLHAYRRFMEVGSLAPISARSVTPAFFLESVWADLPARVLILAGILASGAVALWPALVLPGREQVFLGFDPSGIPHDVVPAVRLFLLPVLNTLIFLVDLLLGLFFFRRTQWLPTEELAERNTSSFAAYFFWSLGLVTPLLFLIGMAFLLGAG